MATLAKRVCKLTGMNVRIEKHGDASVVAIDVQFDDYLLVAEEFALISREEHAQRLLFDDSGVSMGARVQQPLFAAFKPFQLAEKLEECGIKITHGVGAEVLEFTGVKIAKVLLERRVGGMTSMSLQAQIVPDLDKGYLDTLASLITHVVELEVDLGVLGAQKSLDLQQPADKPKAGKRKGRATAEETAGVTH